MSDTRKIVTEPAAPAVADALAWRREPPEMPGWYWYRNAGRLPVVARVCFDDESGVETVTFTGNEGAWYFRDTPAAEWAGPLAPPPAREVPTTGEGGAMIRRVLTGLAALAVVPFAFVALLAVALWQGIATGQLWRDLFGPAVAEWRRGKARRAEMTREWRARRATRKG